MDWDTYHAMVGDVSLWIERKSQTLWELWYMSRVDGSRFVDSAPSARLCMALITPEKFAERQIVFNSEVFSGEPLHWVALCDCA